MDKTEKGLLEHVLDLVQEKFLVDGGTNPVVFANTMEKEILLLEASPLGDPQVKHRFYDLLKVFFAVYHVYEYVIASEAWTCTETKDDKIKCRPSEHPDRKEIVILTYVSRERQEVKIFDTAMVDGVKQLKPSDMAIGNSWRGDFFELLSLDPFPEEQAKKLRKEMEEHFGVKFTKQPKNTNVC